jgi:hypothetical protein
MMMMFTKSYNLLSAWIMVVLGKLMVAQLAKKFQHIPQPKCWPTLPYSESLAFSFSLEQTPLRS